MARKPADQSVHPDDIILAAADVLQHHGYEATTMKDIAAAVNLTAASLYHHFRSKDELLLAVLERGLDYAIERLDAIADSNRSPEQKLCAMIETHIISVTSNTAVGAAMVFEIRALMHINAPPESVHKADNHSDDDFITRRNNFFARRDDFEAIYRAMIQDGIDAGDFRPVDVGIFTKAMLGAHNWVSVWYREGGRLTGEEIAQQMAETFLRALKP